MPRKRGTGGKVARGDGAPRPHAFWSGTLAFGLVAVPVNLFSALRSDRVSLRMVAPDGTPLVRRYFCSAEGVPVGTNEIVRGYEVDDGEFVIVGDDELDALAPEKSREIDLRRFVPRGEVDPGRFERAYVLAPDKGATKAYRLLARAMEAADRVGIATFVMRGKEYLVAILAEDGLLLAETLRFADELRDPEDVGLEGPKEADGERVAALTEALASMRADRLDTRELVDRRSRRLRNLVEAKLEAGDDVLRAMAAPAPEETEDEDAAPPDLMQVLKSSLEATEASGGPTSGGGGRARSETGAFPKGRRTRAGAKPDRDDLMRRTKEELYETAKELDIAGRSGMSKQELIDAIRS